MEMFKKHHNQHEILAESEPKQWEEIFVNHISDKRLVSRIGK